MKLLIERIDTGRTVRPDSKLTYTHVIDDDVRKRNCFILLILIYTQWTKLVLIDILHQMTNILFLLKISST